MIYKSPRLIAILQGLHDWAESQKKYLKGEDFEPTWALEGDVNIMDPTEEGVIFEDTALDPKLLEMHRARNPYYDVMWINAQINALATLERSFRGRHMSPIRALYSVAGRQEGQAEMINKALE